MSNEPVVSLILGLITAGIALLVAFGVQLTAEQIAAITGFAGAALALALFVRSKVTLTKNLGGGDNGR